MLTKILIAYEVHAKIIIYFSVCILFTLQIKHIF